MYYINPKGFIKAALDSHEPSETVCKPLVLFWAKGQDVWLPWLVTAAPPKVNTGFPNFWFFPTLQTKASGGCQQLDLANNRSNGIIYFTHGSMIFP